jgi:hypothetical protein
LNKKTDKNHFDSSRSEAQTQLFDCIEGADPHRLQAIPLNSAETRIRSTGLEAAPALRGAFPSFAGRLGSPQAPRAVQTINSSRWSGAWKGIQNIGSEPMEGGVFLIASLAAPANKIKSARTDTPALIKALATRAPIPLIRPTRGPAVEGRNPSGHKGPYPVCLLRIFGRIKKISSEPIGVWAL